MTRASTETITVGSVGVRFLIEGSESNGTVSIFECFIPADAVLPVPHSHDAFEETIFGLRGATIFTVGGEAVEIGVGDAVCIPRGVVHGFENRGDADAAFLAIASPGILGPAYFREIGDVLAASAGGPPDRAAVNEVMHRHGLTPAPAAARA